MSSPGVHVVPRSDLLRRAGPDASGFDDRPFEGHDALRPFLPEGVTSLAWLSAREGQGIPIRSRPGRVLLLILSGSARVVGRESCPVGVGDAVTVPCGKEYGFTAVGPQGLQVLEVTISDADAGARESETLEQLLARNEERAAIALENPLFRLVRGGGLSDAGKRRRLLGCLQVFSDAFQTMIFMRQATCRDEQFAPTFLAHFREEQGHNDLLGHRGALERPDPVLTATSSWFCRRMLVLDNLDKAVLVHLVLETAGYHFHTIAKHELGPAMAGDYFSAHSAADEGHKDAAARLLEGHAPSTYRRLHRVVEDGWDMFEAMGRRIGYLVSREEAE